MKISRLNGTSQIIQNILNIQFDSLNALLKAESQPLPQRVSYALALNGDYLKKARGLAFKFQITSSNHPINLAAESFSNGYLTVKLLLLGIELWQHSAFLFIDFKTLEQWIDRIAQNQASNGYMRAGSGYPIDIPVYAPFSASGTQLPPLFDEIRINYTKDPEMGTLPLLWQSYDYAFPRESVSMVNTFNQGYSDKDLIHFPHIKKIPYTLTSPGSSDYEFTNAVPWIHLMSEEFINSNPVLSNDWLALPQ